MVAVTAAATLVATGALTLAAATPAAAAPAPAGVSPVLQRSAANVTADALPTVQIDGVVWSQAVVGDTVYAGGEFANARPAGAAAGTQLTPRSNLLAYSISTGNLVTSFAPSLNAQAKIVVASPDGSRIYVGGAFTQANGVTRNRIAAYSTSTGQLVSTFAPSLNAGVYSLSVSNTAVYVGGAFSSANGVARSRLAAFNPANGALLSWAPSADASVNALQVVPDQSRVIVGGSFQTINGAPAYGLGAVDTTGALVPWAANQVVQDGGSNAAVINLSTDGTSIFSSSYVYGQGGNFEGNMSADPNTGTINWLADCHGDTYGTFATGDIVYSVGHQHFCSNIGGFPDTNPRNIWHRSTAFTNHATGTVQPNGEPGAGYGNFAGQPSPSLIDWMPDLDSGTYTGQSQAAWSVSGNSQYVVEGGEFPKVNGTAQQGLVRFAVPAKAPNKQGPRLSSSQLKITTLARSNTSVRVTWGSDWDRDDQNLTYTLTRNGKTVYTTTAPSQSWNLPQLGYIDTGLTKGTTYTYRIKVTDPSGNLAYSDNVTATTPTTNSAADGPYVQDVLQDGASDFWRLDQTSGATVNYDYAGFSDLTLGSGVTGGATGAINDQDAGSMFDGSGTGSGGTTTPIVGPNTFTESAWFSTTSTSGGKIVGFGDKSSGTSSNYDRHIYMDAAGHITFGVYNNNAYVITSPKSYNDGAFHQVVASLSSDGLRLYIDGKLIGTNAGTTIGQAFTGYWRVGGDSSWSGSNFFTGTIDDVAIYPTALTLAQVRQQYLDSGRTLAGSTAPADSYGAAVYNDAPALYYRVDETSGTVAADRSGNGANGTYYGGVTQGASSPVSGATGTAAVFNGVDGTVSSNDLAYNPTVYSEELWFKTTSTAGGKLIGFGDAQSGNSGSYDRHVYMLSSGQLVFGTYTGQLNLATSPKSYNDGSWHYVVATQGPDGMTLYVDGVAVASNPQTQAQAFNGYWRIGGDNLNGWNANGAFFAGTIDEAAVYYSELTSAQVAAHYRASGAAVATNHAPTASFTSTPTNLSVAFDGSGSSDPDGDALTYAWTFGDGTTGTGVTPSHTYAAAGTYSVQLTVSDPGGLTGTKTASVTVSKANQAPVASFTSTPTNLSVAFDGSGSSDPDGDTLTYAWTFGDGSTGTGVSPSHTYAAAGTYSVQLTVSDPSGLTNVKTASVTVSPAAPTVFASDSFTRTGTWGSADVGGAWTLSGGASSFTTDGSRGNVKLAAASAGPLALLNGVSATNVDQTVDVSVDKDGSGNGTLAMLLARRSGAGDYRLKLKFLPSGVLHLAWSKVVAGKETVGSEVTIKNVTYAPGDVFRMRFLVSGNGTTTTVSGKAWKVGTTEPTAWQTTGTDTEATLQGAGAVGLYTSLGSTASNSPVTVSYDNYTVKPA